MEELRAEKLNENGDLGWIEESTRIQLNKPPSSGPPMAEQLQVTLKAWDHFALLWISTSSEVMTQTELTIPPPPMPDTARAPISHFKSWENITTRGRSL